MIMNTAKELVAKTHSSIALLKYEKILVESGSKDSPYWNAKKYYQLMKYYENKLILHRVIE